MWWPVVCVLLCNIFPTKTLWIDEPEYREPEYDSIPDFTDYEDLSEYNFSELYVAKKIQHNRVQRNELGLEPLTPASQEVDEFQETPIAYGPVLKVDQKFQTLSVLQNFQTDSMTNLLEDLQSRTSENVITNYIVETNKYSNSFKKTPNRGFQKNGLGENYYSFAKPNRTDDSNEDIRNNFLKRFGIDIGPARRIGPFANRRKTTTTEMTRSTNYWESCWPWPFCVVFWWIYNLFTWTDTEETFATFNFSRKLDIEALVDMLNYVAWDYDNAFNLTNRFNETLQKYDIPTCEPLPPPPTINGTVAPTTTTLLSTIDFNSAHLVAKCFVCGLHEEGIPRSSACADAFSGDFIPLVKVDPKARGKIATFRKYCRYLNVPNFMETPEEPQSQFGRFTGGCSVRWADLTGVYTQRACRNRRRAVTGKHFASKRMAKLEMTLSDLDNGCVISPMATLLPVSRSISLYARFHACVCTGSWCNKAVQTENWLTTNVLLILITNINR